MTKSDFHEILTQEQEQKILESCGYNEKKMKEDMSSIIEWCSKEEHLKEALPFLVKTRWIERQLLISKGSLEECKMRLDRLLTARSLMPDVCLYRTLEDYEKIRKYVCTALVPKMSPKGLERVIITQLNPVDNYDDFDILALFRLQFFMLEHRFYDDIVISNRFVYDLKYVRIGILTKLNPISIKKIEKFATETHGLKIKGICVINAPPFVDKLIAIVKQVVKQKLHERIHVYRSNEDFEKDVPKDILPADYGGDEKPCVDLYEQWRNMMERDEAKERMKVLDKVVSDEKRRIGVNPHEEHLTTKGTFRKLELD